VSAMMSLTMATPCIKNWCLTLWQIQKNYTMGKNDLIVNKSIKAMKLANNSSINIHHKLNLRIHHAREIEKTN